jgi:FkbM family methyltransferase
MWDYLRKYHPAKPLIAALGADLKVRIYPKDVLGRYIYIDGVFERDCWNFVKRFLQPDMVVFDLGANFGQYTLLAARCVGEHGRVHSFEPSHRIFGELQFNVELNGLSERCTLNRLAVSDAAGVARLSRYEEGAEVYGSLGSHRRSEATVIGYEEVQTIRLDDYIAEKKIDHVDFIKMDIEGAELLALKGAERLLRDHAPTILLEMADINTDGFGYKAVEIWDFLTALGYQIHDLSGNGSTPGRMERPLAFRGTSNVVAIKMQGGVPS